MSTNVFYSLCNLSATVITRFANGNFGKLVVLRVHAYFKLCFRNARICIYLISVRTAINKRPSNGHIIHQRLFIRLQRFSAIAISFSSMRHRLLNDSRHGVWRALHSTLRRTAYLPLFAATLVMLPFNVDADYVTVQPADVTAKFHGSVTFNEASGAYTINATTVKGFDVLFRVNVTRPLTFRVTDDSRNNSL